MSSQRRPSCQGSLPSHALAVLERALRQQFELGLGVGLLSGVRGKRTTPPIASSGGETVDARDRHIGAFAASAQASARPLGKRERKCTAPSAVSCRAESLAAAHALALIGRPKTPGKSQTHQRASQSHGGAMRPFPSEGRCTSPRSLQSRRAVDHRGSAIGRFLGSAHPACSSQSSRPPFRDQSFSDQVARVSAFRRSRSPVKASM
jgi:hypothetical protein